MLGIFFGCTMAVVEELLASFKTFLDKAGVKYETFGVDQCCGIPLLLSGLTDEAREQGKKVVDAIASTGTETLVTNCPHCYKAFSHEYGERLGIEVPFTVLHFTQYAAQLLKERGIELPGRIDLKLVYHDPCYLGRMGDGIYDPPRELLRRIPGVEIEEPELTKEETTCCGGGGLVRAVLPKISAEVAREKLNLQIAPLGVQAVVSSCPFCYLNLKEGAEGMEGIEIYDLGQLLVRSLNGGEGDDD